MKKMSLKAKMLLCILPVMGIAMAILTYIAAQELSSNLQTANTDSMFQNVSANAGVEF